MQTIDDFKRIVLLETGQAGGGSFGSQYLLAKELSKEGYQITIVYLNKTVWVARARQLGLDVRVITDIRFSLNAPKNVRRIMNKFERIIDKHGEIFYVLLIRLIHRRSIARLTAILRETSADILHLNNQSNRDLFGVISAKRAGVPCVSHLRSHRSDHFGKCRARYINENVSVVVSASKITLEHWAGLGINREKMTVIYNGVRESPSERLSNCHLKRQINIPKSDFLFGVVGSLTKEKGHQNLLEAWTVLVKEESSAHLLIVGEGAEEQNIRLQISESGLETSVSMMGYQSNGQEIIAALDGFVLPSSTEVCSRVILESLISRTPVIASKVGGNPELVDGRTTGLLFNYGDKNELARQMKTIMNNFHLRSAIAEAGYLDVQERFSVHQYVQSIKEIYTTLISNKRLESQV
jgi:glycosyltransferase involved in cell wall biosynthesis